MSSGPSDLAVTSGYLVCHALTPVFTGATIRAMKLKSFLGIVFALALGCASLLGQTVASSVVGTVVDPADAAVAGAQVTLTNTGTGAVRQASTDSLGTYRFVKL